MKIVFRFRGFMKSQTDSQLASPSIRNILVLELLSRHKGAITPSKIMDELKLPKATVHRLLAYLEEQGFIIRDFDGKSYLPSLRLREMAIGVMHSTLGNQASKNILQWLNQQIEETCNLAVPDHDAMIYIDRVETHWPLRIALHIGSRVPLTATAAGKLALSQLSPAMFNRYIETATLQSYTPKTITDKDRFVEAINQIRTLGYATDQEEFIEGMIAVAVPVLNSKNEFCATLSFHAPKQRMTLERGLAHLDDLRAAARKLGALIL